MEDKHLRAVDATGQIRLGLVYGKEVVELARHYHNTTPTSTAALGRTLMAGLLMMADLKSEKDALSLHIDGDGPLGKILVTGKNDGAIKGYVAHPEADAPLRDDGKLNVGAVVGKGNLTVVMDLGMREPYVGQVELVTGEIGDDIANYYARSQQVPTAVGLGVLVDRDYSVLHAGGFLAQTLPDASEESVKALEERLSKITSVTDLFASHEKVEDIVEEILGEGAQILHESPVSYRCDCSREKVTESLLSLGPVQLEELLKEDKGAEVTCHFCNRAYLYGEKELGELVEKARVINS